MRIDYMCNGCGYEFSLDSDKNTEKHCPDCRSNDIFPIPLKMPEEGYQSWVFDEQ